ncbi:hypothetical protein PY650_35965 [Rhizobium calliandrae]|uniref:Uncharacterized protein n=1 Tax=Rhizobium calliandrae TaxID=1312182 RepID=A0ABT7KRY1_9HYPH|nr:hypothetical protein [Rhizobium calliandrae]MDL2410838.1 hypothetical protein [Rhizobium calliandrae]
MQSKPIPAAVFLVLAGLLSSCVVESSPSGYNGYSSGYYSGGYYGGTVIYGGSNRYRSRYSGDRYRYDHRSFHGHGRSQHSIHHRPENRHYGRRGSHHHRSVPRRAEGNR